MTSRQSGEAGRRGGVRRGEARERLLQAARELITAQGMEGVSIRAINAAAGVSAGILHYHFGGLDELVVELLGRNMAPLMQERAELLEAIGETGHSPVPRDLAEVLVMPLARFAIDGGAEGIAHVRLLARLHADRSPPLQQAEQRWSRQINAALFEALRGCNPGVPDKELALRLDLASHVLLRGLAALHQPPSPWQAERGLGSMDPWDQARLVIDFVAAGLAGGR